MTTIQDILLNKAREGKLGHFYIVETSLEESESFQALIEFTHQFIQRYYQQIEGGQRQLTDLRGHPDVFLLGNLPATEDKETANYTVDESQSLNRFFEFRPVEARRKFAIITEGHRITERVANKWLKLLEEPQGNSTIILLNPRGQKLLDTIHSRAIHIRLPTHRRDVPMDEWREFLEETRKLTLSQFLEANLKSEKDAKFRTTQLLKWEADQHDQPSIKDATTAWLRKLQEMETFHQPAATKWALFYSHLHQYVLSRASH